MSRALVRAGALLASLFVVLLLLVPAASAASGGSKEPERQLSIQTSISGFKVAIEAQEGNGKQDVVLVLVRHHQFAEYVVPAQITDSTVTASFPGLGELDYTYAPKGSTSAECFGAEGSEVSFSGTFTFTGERGYVHIDADHATGYYTLEPQPSGCRSQRADRAAPAARAAPVSQYSGDGATLTASTAPKTKAGVRSVRAFTASREPSGKQATVSAALVEGVQGMGVVRGVEMTAPGRAFEWDFGAGTATVAPSAPFAGSGSLTRSAGGRTAFTGSLRVPILGAGTVRMAGADFKAALHRGTRSEP